MQHLCFIHPFPTVGFHSSEICGPYQNATIASGMLSLNRPWCELAVLPYDASQYGIGGCPLQMSFQSPSLWFMTYFHAINAPTFVLFARHWCNCAFNWTICIHKKGPQQLPNNHAQFPDLLNKLLPWEHLQHACECQFQSAVSPKGSYCHYNCNWMYKYSKIHTTKLINVSSPSLGTKYSMVFPAYMSCSKIATCSVPQFVALYQ